MSDTLDLSAEPKERGGKGAARAARRSGRIPAVIYGAKKDPVMITLDPLDVRREIDKAGFFATLFDINVAGGKKERVLARDLQLHPVTDSPLHIDFLRVSAATEVTVQVPCSFVNEEESPGLKRGGVLNVVRYEIELSCRADAIPQEIVIDLAGLDIGEGVHISTVSLPDGVTPTITDRDFTIATIAAPTVVTEEEAAEGEEGVAEGEAGAAPEDGAEGEAEAAESSEESDS